MTKKVTMPDEAVEADAPEEEVEPDIEAILNAPDSEPEDEGELAEVEDDEDEDEEESVSIDELPDDSELWPGGPLIGEIKAWKELYGDKSVYVTSITFDQHVVWRTIKRSEYKSHIRNMEKLMQSGQLGQADANLYNEEAIAQLCILFPEYDRRTAGDELAGIPAIISQEVLEASGFVALEVRQL